MFCVISELFGGMHELFSENQYTVLIPSDTAFNKLAKWQQDRLFKSKQLRDILLMHYIRGPPMPYATLLQQKSGTQFPVDACGNSSIIHKTSGYQADPVSFSAYGGPPVKIDARDIWTRRVSAQGIDTLMIPGPTSCLGDWSFLYTQAAGKPGTTPGTATPTPVPFSPPPVIPVQGTSSRRNRNRNNSPSPPRRSRSNSSRSSPSPSRRNRNN